MLYHTSQTPGLKELEPKVSTHQTPYVYAISNRVTSLLFGAKKDDFDFLMDEEDGVTVLYECYEGAFEHIYRNKKCYLYEVEETGFLQGVTGWEPEWVSEEKVKVKKETQILDLYQELLAAEQEKKLVIHRFCEEPSYKAMISSELVSRIFCWDLWEKLAGDERFEHQYKKLYEELEKIMSGSCL